MEEKFLPIGTVCKLTGGKNRVMVTGYAAIDFKNKNKVYDYCGCLFPAGVLSTDETLLFDHSQIEKIDALGYADKEQKEFNKKLIDLLSEENISKILADVNKE